nr:MAG TPA: Prominin [Caudoviricetes sp.]
MPARYENIFISFVEECYEIRQEACCCRCCAVVEGR